MAEEKELTRKELAEALDRASSLIAEQGKQIAALMAAPPRTQTTPRPGPQKVPFKGLVHAKAACYIGSLRKEGDAWYHEADCLWSDDPFEPCVQVGTKDDGSPVTKSDPNAPAPVPFHLRPSGVEAMAARALTPQTASQW